MPEIPASVLLVRLGAIGDVTNALVVARGLERARPDVSIGWAVHDLASPLVTGHPSVDRVHLWRRGSGPGGWRALVGELRAARYDLAIDLQRIQKSAFLARASGAPRVLGFDRARTKEASWIWTRERLAPGDPQGHRVEQYLDVLRHLGVARPTAERLLPEDPAAAAWAGALAARLGGAPIVVCVGASKAPNRWAPERFAALARGLAREHGVPLCLVGGPGDREAFAATLQAVRDEPGVCDLVGRSSLPELIALLRTARLFVGCDTGPMHLAAALDVPVVALFGPADPRRTGPWGAGHVVVRGPDRTMDSVAVEAVLEAVRARSGGRPPDRAGSTLSSSP